MILSRRAATCLHRLMPCLVLIVLVWFPACTPHREEPVSAARLPVSTQSIRLFNTTLLAELYTTADGRPGFDFKTAGLLPVRCRIDHQGRTPLYIHPQQSFLLDRDYQAWPLLTGEQARHRILAAPLNETARQSALRRLWGESPLAPASLLAFGLVTSAPAATPAVRGLLRRPDSMPALALDTRQMSGRASVPLYGIRPGTLAEAWLFFPDQAGSHGGVSLRLGLEIEQTRRSVNIPLTVQ